MSDEPSRGKADCLRKTRKEAFDLSILADQVSVTYFPPIPPLWLEVIKLHQPPFPMLLNR